MALEFLSDWKWKKVWNFHNLSTGLWTQIPISDNIPDADFFYFIHTTYCEGKKGPATTKTAIRNTVREDSNWIAVSRAGPNDFVATPGPHSQYVPQK